MSIKNFYPSLSLSLLAWETHILQHFSSYAADFCYGPQNQQQKFQLCTIRKSWGTCLQPIMGAKWKQNLIGEKNSKNNKRILVTHVTHYSQKNCIPDSTFPHHFFGLCVKRRTFQDGGRSGCCSHMAMQPGMAREEFVGRQHIIILQQPQLFSPLGHGEMTLHSPSLCLPACHYGRG